MKKKLFSGMCLILAIVITGCLEEPPFTQTPVTIRDRGNYFEVILNYNAATPYEVGREYALMCEKAMPGIWALQDSYLSDYCDQSDSLYPGVDAYALMLWRVSQFITTMPEEYREELKGYVSSISPDIPDIKGDGFLSVNESYALQFLGDVGRFIQCSAVGVFGSLSATGKTIMAKNQDWFDGYQNQALQYPAVIKMIKGKKILCSISVLGAMTLYDGFSSDKVFTSILSSLMGKEYSAENCSSIGFEIRYALEHFSTSDEAAAYLTDSARTFSYGHLIIMGDPNKSFVVENNVSDDAQRRIRYYDSPLNDRVQPWPLDTLKHSIGAVNSFVLKGNWDNHTYYDYYVGNQARWATMIRAMEKYAPGKIGIEEVKKVITDDQGDGPGDITDGDLYNTWHSLTILFQPHNFHLEIAFRPKDGSFPEDPVFETIPLFSID